MNLNTLIADVEAVSVHYAEHFNIERTDDWFMLKLTEEMGEMTQSYLKYQGQARVTTETAATLRLDFENELADVLGSLLLIANHHNIDIEQAISRKWLKYLSA